MFILSLNVRNRCFKCDLATIGKDIKGLEILLKLIYCIIRGIANNYGKIKVMNKESNTSA